MHGCTLFALLAIAVLRWSISVLAPNKGSNAMPAADRHPCNTSPLRGTGKTSNAGDRRGLARPTIT